MANVGLSGSLEEVIPAAGMYTLLLYAQKKREDGRPCTTLDELRYILASSTHYPAAHRPPMEDAFQQHVSRALYQTAVWRHSHVAKPHLWNPVGLSCVAIMPPRRGSFYVESGTGVSVGSVLAFWCRDGYQLVGSDRIYCNVRNGKPQWSNYLPVCEAIPRPEDRGLRVAVLASVVSGVVILAMSLSFLICCLQERSGRDRAKREGRSRRRENRSARRGECWLEREEGEWDAFPPPKIFHLSQRMDPRLAPDSPLYLTGGLTGYENRGYQRSQESLLKASLPGLYRSESQLYPHIVLQRVPTPTAPSAPLAPSAPVYLHLPPSSSTSNPSNTAAHPQPHIMAPYPTPTYPPNPNALAPAPIYPNPNPAPQQPWQ
ncbi:uncharacterized protein ACN63O_017306 [Diretmus argenteus]